MKPFQGTINLDIRDSKPDWSAFLADKPPAGAPNVLVVLYDDTGCAAWAPFGGRINMPTLQRIADNGLIYSQWHTTALCSPTRSCFLTGRNHHQNGFASISENASGFPGYNSHLPPENAPMATVLRDAGWSTFWVGKNHTTPIDEFTMGASKKNWPLGQGYDRFYGFNGGETNNWYPDLIEDNHFALLKHMFNMAEHWQLFFGRNPVKGVKFLEEDNLQIRSLSEADEENLLQCCSPYLEDLVTFAINTGLRLGEILNLKWEEVDLEHAAIKMLVRKNRRMLEVPLNDRALTVVNGWFGLRKCEYVFYNPETGGRWKDLWLGLKKACRKAGLNDVTWHTFRHTFASRLTRNGADLVTVKELLGHSSVSVTMRYAHTNRDAKKRAVGLIVGNGAKLVTPPIAR